MRWTHILPLVMSLGCTDKDGTETSQGTQPTASDCDAPSTFYKDGDGDGFGDAAQATESCSPPTGHVEDNTDCDDANSAVHPAATEVCNGEDDDCDGILDDDDPDATGLLSLYVDADGDGFGHQSVEACPQVGLSEQAGDCDDTDADRSPDATEQCDDGIDQDCDTDIDCDDTDCDGSCPEDCRDGRDNDGDGLLDCEDADCGSDGACIETPDECDDNRDNDRDGLTDCEDEDCWQLGGCVRSSARLTGADHLAAHRSQQRYEAFRPGGFSSSYQTETTLEAGGLTGELSVQTLSGTAVCGFSLPSGPFVQRDVWRDGRHRSSSAESSTFTLSSGCPMPWAASLLPTLSRDVATSASGRVVFASLDGRRVPWLAASRWTTSFSRDGDTTVYFGTDGSGGITSYGRWWSTSVWQSEALELEISSVELSFSGVR